MLKATQACQALRCSGAHCRLLPTAAITYVQPTAAPPGGHFSMWGTTVGNMDGVCQEAAGEPSDCISGVLVSSSSCSMGWAAAVEPSRAAALVCLVAALQQRIIRMLLLELAGLQGTADTSCWLFHTCQCLSSR